SETDRSEQNSDIEDDHLSKTNQISALIKRLETLEKLQPNYNKVNNRKNEPIQNDNNNDISRKKKGKKNLKSNKRSRKMNNSSSSEIESASDKEDSIPMLIEKPSETTYINIPKFLKIDKPIYNSYQNDKIRNKGLPTETRESFEEFVAGLGTSVKVNKTQSPPNNTRSTSITFASRTPLTTLQPNINETNEIQDISSNSIIGTSGTSSKKSQNSGCMLRPKSPTKARSNDPVNEVTEAATIKKSAKKRSSKAPNNARTNSAKVDKDFYNLQIILLVEINSSTAF
ncbi:7833_t:CDS:2, partial [Racocetra fulgida]